MRNRYTITTMMDKTREVGIYEIYEGQILQGYPEGCRALIEAICEHWNAEDAAAAATWATLEQLELHRDPFVIGRQAVLIEAGCPYRPSTYHFAAFKHGERLQKYLGEM